MGPRVVKTTNAFCSSIQYAREEIVESPAPSSTSLNPSKEMKTIFVLDDIVVGQEAGMATPQVGQDRQWLKNCMDDFEGRIQNLIAEVKESEAQGGLQDVAKYWKSRGH